VSPAVCWLSVGGGVDVSGIKVMKATRVTEMVADTASTCRRGGKDVILSPLPRPAVVRPSISA
jgi:hypothetical protein